MFFFACIQALRGSGELGFLLPEAFFNISNFEATRRKALEFEIQRMVDYGKPFKGLVTRAQAIVLKKSPSTHQNSVICQSYEATFSRASYSFGSNPKTIFNLNCSHEDSEVLSHIFSLPHILLRDRARWALGIVTGNNKKFIQKSNQKDHIPVFKGSDILNSGLKEPTTFIPSDLSLYQQVAPTEFYEAEEKLIYKFISSKLSFFHDTDQRYILNSANLLIPDPSFPISAKNLAALLSSDFMNWVFVKLFNTHKILRGDLECLPIHSEMIGDGNFQEDRLLLELGIEKLKNGTYRIKK